jgi:DUF1009 family protein
MERSAVESLGIIAGRGVYPLLLAESARQQGVRRLHAVAFRGETDRGIERRADQVAWIHLGQLGAMLDAIARSGVRDWVMAGQITPTHLFRVRPDGRLIQLLRRLRARNAETIFGAVSEELAAVGVCVLPASSFMEAHMPGAGLLTRRAPSEEEASDIRIGFGAALATSGLDIGQTVVVKQGTILAVEAFEGTDETILRAGRLGGEGSVVVKLAKRGHDMRFDIPVVGLHTLKVLRKARAGVLAFEAGRCIVLGREAVVEEADRRGLCLTALAPRDGAGPGEGGGHA